VVELFVSVSEIAFFLLPQKHVIIEGVLFDILSFCLIPGYFGDGLVSEL